MTNQRPPSEHQAWSLAEAIDLPLALEDERFSANRESALAQAREEIGRELRENGNAPNEPAVLRAWLRRWQAKQSGDTPGEWLEHVLLNAGRIATLAGIVLGLVGASDKLFFTGGEPVNVFFLIGVFVLLPIALTATLLLTVALRRPGQGNWIQQLFLFLARKITRLAQAWRARENNGLSPDASWVAIAKALGKNRALVQAPVLGISQKLALGFGVGLLIMLQLRVSFWELAFGWQTTLAAPGEVWHLLTRAIAAPWSWVWPEGAPTLEQINSTRYSRLPGARPIDPAASRAWWPFLFATILVWSVMLRAMILVALRAWQNRALRAFVPDSADARLLARRLSPHWSAIDAAASPLEPAKQVAQAKFPSLREGAWTVLAADESDATMPASEDLPRLFGMSPEKTIRFQFDDSLAPSTTAALESLRENRASVLVLLPVSRDPIDEVNDTLAAVAGATGKSAIVVLRGPADRLAVWKRKLEAWGTGLAVEYLPVP
jgi:hypothetical protein